MTQIRATMVRVAVARCTNLAVDFYDLHVSDKQVDIPPEHVDDYRAYAQLGGYIRTGKVPEVPMSACPHGVPHRWPCEQCDTIVDVQELPNDRG